MSNSQRDRYAERMKAQNLGTGKGAHTRAVAIADRIAGERKRYILACRAFVVEVETDARDVIVVANRQAAQFYGKPLAALLGWMSKFGTVEASRMEIVQSRMFE